MLSLRVIGSIYILSGMWCGLNPILSASNLGFVFSVPQAQVEYLSVYGGLQLGLGIAMILVSLNPRLLLGGVFFSMVFSIVLMLTRIAAMTLYGTTGTMWILLLLESCIALVLIASWYKSSGYKMD